MSSQFRRVVWVLLLAFAAASAVMLVFRNNVREIVVIPLLYVAWLGSLIFNSLHQGVYWALLLIVVGLILARSLKRKSGAMPHVARAAAAPRKSRRVAYWAQQIERNANESFNEPHALEGFRELIISVWAFRTSLSPGEIERDIQAGRVKLPHELALFFQQEAYWEIPEAQVKAQSDGRPARPFLLRGLTWARRAWRRVMCPFQLGDSLATVPFEQHVNSMIQSLEDQLSVGQAPPHGGGNPTGGKT